MLNRLLRLPLRTLACALLFAAGGWANAHADGPEPDQPAPRPAIAETMENARLLVSIGHFDEALSLLRTHLKAGATDTELLFVLGLASAGKVQHGPVVEPERQARSTRQSPPFARSWQRARITCGPDRACNRLFLMEDDRLARKHFEQALADELRVGWLSTSVCFSPRWTLANASDGAWRPRGRTDEDQWTCKPSANRDSQCHGVLTTPRPPRAPAHQSVEPNGTSQADRAYRSRRTRTNGESRARDGGIRVGQPPRRHVRACPVILARVLASPGSAETRRPEADQSRRTATRIRRSRVTATASDEGEGLT